ncbi:MAG TPA: DUF488 domain-containing protein [Bauldia sp.]|nr:DUF488 domain-containing protein [Bauldia sp.]
MDEIVVKRIYEAPSPDDGLRILVDRVWPRGVSREAAAIAAWDKDLAPSTGLRKWFGHDPARFAEFRARYEAELRHQASALEGLLAERRGRRLTLLYSARDTEHNQAVVLREVLQRLAGAGRTRQP